MEYEQFVDGVQHRARLASRAEAVAAIRATLESLSERITGDEPKECSVRLPGETGQLLRKTCEGEGHQQAPSIEDFLLRTGARENVPPAKAALHARTVLQVLREAIPADELEVIRTQLPEELRRLLDPEPEPETVRPAIPRLPQTKDIETQHPEVTNPDAKLVEAAQMMRKMDIGVLPVSDGDQLVGMISDRDITIRATAEGRDPNTTLVKEIMTPEVICCYEDQDVAEVARVMEENQVRRLPVMDRDHHLVGIVSLGDLAVRAGSERMAGEVLEKVSEHQPITVLR